MGGSCGVCWNACSLYRSRLSATNFKGLVPWHSIGYAPLSLATKLYGLCSTKLGQVMRLRTLYKKTLHSLLHCSLALATAQTHKIRDAGCEVSGVRCGAAHPRGPLARGPRLTGNACPCLAASRGESRRHCLPCHPCRRPPWPGAGVEAPPLSLPFQKHV